MGKVFTHMTMSLDGFVADPDDGIGELFEWYEGGEVSVPSATSDRSLQVDEAGAQVLHEWIDNTGALVAGRHLFDMTDGWGDKHPMGVPVVVVTHHAPENAAERWPNTTFVGDVTTAITEAKRIAGDKNVTIASTTIIQQALDLGLVDEVCVSLVPVLFGEGVSYFGELANGHLLLDDPVVVPGRRATHLSYRVRR
ncbi:dihydrofolate reductase family protein [Nocardia sp. NPDC050378]|uniref:dihydrofolate reductase family protein n=1 Tax=Nocardia sp. NPDC050378 TaxID=3155400 RepID=UPI0033FFAE7C